ncbi:MAG: TolC family protein [Candidatus Aminicenantes bacterium]|nr:TolC family protein [Candidatus Aminicenantes bacterium]
MPAIDRPESWADRMRRETPARELSVKDAIRLALVNNLEIAIEDYNEDLNRQNIFRSKGFYDPRLRFQVGWTATENPSRSILDAGQGIPVNTTDQIYFDTSLVQNLPNGSSLTLNFNNNRFSTNSTFSFMNPSFGSNFSIMLRQPLWRGFRKTQTRRELKLYNLETEISDSQFQQKVSEIVQQVQKQYWELVFAIESYEAIRKSMELAIIQHENNRKRVQIGVMASIEITASRAEVATREQEMIQSEVRIITAQNGLKRHLAPDPTAPIWNLTLIPTQLPQVQDLAITLDEAIARAMERRPELEQNRLLREQVEVDREYYKQDGRPTVDLVASLTNTGRAGEIFGSEFVDTDGDGVPDTRLQNVPQPSNPFFGGFGNSWGQVFGFDYINYTLGVSVEIPLRNRANEAERASLLIRDRQLASRLKNQQQMIIVEVRNAYESIATQRKRLEAARVARQLSEAQLEGENKRFQAGLSTNFEVLRYQRDLSQSQVQELRARVDYQQAVTDLEKAMYTIVDSSDIVLARRD